MAVSLRTSFDVSSSCVSFFSQQFPSRRFPVALMAIVATMFALPVLAGDEIAIKPAQIQAIGITVKQLGEPSPSSGVAYSARVVLPRANEQIVSAAVTGVIDQVLVEDHATVSAGQPLLRLNSPEFGELQLKLLEATNQGTVAQSTLTREKALFAEGIVPERRVIEAQAAASNAQAAVQHARAAVRLAGADEATVARIATGQVQERLELRAVKAGSVLAIEVKPGQRVADADPLLKLGDLSTMWLDIDLPADKANAWDPEGTLRVVGREVVATPVSVSAQVSGGQTATLRAAITMGTELVRPGEFVQVQVPLRTASEAWVVPNAAVVREDSRTVVFVRTPTGFAAKDVTVVGESSTGISVTGSLTPTDSIAMAGTVALKAAWLGAAGAEEE